MNLITRLDWEGHFLAVQIERLIPPSDERGDMALALLRFRTHAQLTESTLKRFFILFRNLDKAGHLGGIENLMMEAREMITSISEKEAIVLHRHERILQIVSKLQKRLQCNCDLDNWEPTRETHHSMVCRIHNEALAEFERETKL